MAEPAGQWVLRLVSALKKNELTQAGPRCHTHQPDGGDGLEMCRDPGTKKALTMSDDAWLICVFLLHREKTACAQYSSTLSCFQRYALLRV